MRGFAGGKVGDKVGIVVFAVVDPARRAGSYERKHSAASDSVDKLGALVHDGEHRSIDEVWDAIYDPDKYVVVQTAPAVRAALGEEFGNPIGTDVTGKMVSALRMVGFDKVFDTDTAADLTIMEEGSEFIERFTHRDVYSWPMFTSCCPGWVRFVKGQFPQFRRSSGSRCRPDPRYARPAPYRTPARSACT